MPFLTRNPNATPRSILAWGIGGTVFGVVVAFWLFNSNKDAEFRRWAMWMLPLIGGAVTALVEWCYDDDGCGGARGDGQNTP